ncbi:OrNVorf41-like-4 [Venturia canescens]|uniref:OrNVorf41-like-4 n=1 Tax=Venturia canescens TaxID=32260 RepID=A0ACB9ZJ24_9HYME|nr:uncharacterized LOC122408867 [Venturia canescens]XP_043271882.1 uncharacterized protein LOC122408867 [Venturia canescens]KAI5630636.1 OrNVorf41-like-4 [Venturia canescens]
MISQRKYNAKVSKEQRNVPPETPPNCDNLGRNIKLFSLSVIMLMIIVLIVLIIAMVMNNALDFDGEDKKQSILETLTIISAVVLGVAWITAIWHISVATKGLRLCQQLKK